MPSERDFEDVLDTKVEFLTECLKNQAKLLEEYHGTIKELRGEIYDLKNRINPSDNPRGECKEQGIEGDMGSNKEDGV